MSRQALSASSLALCTPAPWPSCWVSVGLAAFSVPVLHWTAQKWTLLQIRSKHCTKEKDHLPWPTGYAAAHAAQDAVGSLYCKDTLLALVQFAVHQDIECPSFKNTFTGYRDTLRECQGMCPWECAAPIPLNLVSLWAISVWPSKNEITFSFPYFC